MIFTSPESSPAAKKSPEEWMESWLISSVLCERVDLMVRERGGGGGGGGGGGRGRGGGGGFCGFCGGRGGLLLLLDRELVDFFFT